MSENMHNLRKLNGSALSYRWAAHMRMAFICTRPSAFGPKGALASCSSDHPLLS
jgi:hypothetical protein